MNSCKIPQIGYLMIGIRRVFLHCHTIRNTFSQKYKGSRSPLPVATNSAKRVHLLQVLQPQQVRQVRQVQQTASRARCKKPTSERSPTYPKLATPVSTRLSPAAQGTCALWPIVACVTVNLPASA